MLTAKLNPLMGKRKLSDGDDDLFTSVKKRKIPIFSHNFFKNVARMFYDDNPHTITPVEDQLSASACYAVNSTAVTSEKHCLDGKSELPIPLSSQDIVDSIHEKLKIERKTVDNFGVSAAPVKAAFEYMKQFGVHTENVYPYIGKRSPIPTIPARALEAKEKMYVRSYTLMDFEESLLYIIKDQPVVGLIDGYPSFLDYKETDGIYMGPTVKEILMLKDKQVLSHCVQVVGIGKEDGNLFFLVKNSYGEEWGYQGYGKVSMRLILHFVFPVETEFAGV